MTQASGGLILSKGYCARHAELLRSFRNGLDTAILYQVRLFFRLLDAIHSGRGKGGLAVRATCGMPLVPIPTGTPPSPYLIISRGA
jgi:hypothetical protein